METSTVRVLVVDDYEPFRRFVCSMLEQKAELRVIGEASDGLEAVQKAEELQPDLILLDIALPTLNGIEVAGRVRKLARKSKIVFVSQESSADVWQETLSIGALGYVVKAHAGRELLAAVEAVLQDKQFVSSALPDQAFKETRTPDSFYSKDVLAPDAPAAQKLKMISRRHPAQFYSDDESF